MATFEIAQIQSKVIPFYNKKEISVPLKRVATRVNKIVEEHAIPFVDLTNDGLSTLKDSLTLADYMNRSTSSQPFQDHALSNLAMVTASFGVFLGGYEIHKGTESYYRAKEISDGESKRRAEAKLFSGTILTNASALGIAGKISQSLSASIGSGVSFSANALGGVGTVFAMGVASWGIYRCHRFRSCLNKELNNPDLSEAERCKSALQFLLKKASVSDGVKAVSDEVREGIEKALDPSLTGEERAAAFHEKLRHKAESQVRYFKRRASTKALRLLVEQSESLIQDLGKDKTQAEAIQKTHTLIRAIKRENSKKIALFTVALATAAVALAAFFLGTCMSLGSLPLILSIVASSIYLITGASSFVVERISKICNHT